MRAVMLSASPWSLMRGMESFILSGVLPQIKSVQWQEGANPHTTGSKIVLPPPIIGMSDIDLALWRYKCQHEIGHESAVNATPHWKEVMTEKKKKHPDKLLWMIGNLLSDHTQERNCLGQWYGRDEVLLRGRELFMRLEVMPTIDPKQKFAQLFLFDTLKRKEWNSHIGLPPTRMVDKDFFAKVEKCGDWRMMRNEAQVFDMALRIRELFPEPESKEEEDESSGKGKKGAGSPEMKEAGKCVVAAHGEKPEAGDDGECVPHTFLDDGTRNECSGSRAIRIRRPVGLDRRPLK